MSGLLRTFYRIRLSSWAGTFVGYFALVGDDCGGFTSYAIHESLEECHLEGNTEF